MQKQLTLNEKVLLAGLELCSGDTKKPFSAEELLVQAWGKDKSVFGLRGYEQKHPDSNKIYTKIDGKDGLVSQGFFNKVGERMLQLTDKGLAYALDLKPGENDLQLKLDRNLQTSVSQIINHPAFKDWLSDPSKPKQFRIAGDFWGVAPGTPTHVVIERVNSVENALQIALDQITKRGTDHIMEEHGKILFEKNDIIRCLEFHSQLKKRFEKELRILGYEFQ